MLGQRRRRCTNAVGCNPSQDDTLPNAGSMLNQRLRRWPNIEPTLGQCIMFLCNTDGIPHATGLLTGLKNDVKNCPADPEVER